MKLVFLPENRACELEDGESILAAARRAGISIAADCMGNGTCGRCIVRAVAGEFSPVTREEQSLIPIKRREEGWRLACRAIPLEDCVVELPDTRDSTGKGGVSLPRGFAPDGDVAKPHYGMAFDIGTTTVAGMMCDMRTGSVICGASRANPQGAYGADVISRIEYCASGKKGLRTLNRALAACLGDISAELLQTAGVKPREVGAALAVGNSTMTHILLETDPSSLARAPFKPVFLSHEPVSAARAGIRLARGAKLAILSNIAGHVGADITGAILSSRICESGEPSLLLDIGTNGEMALAANNRLLVCSTAAGPAFEGACIKCGMRSAPGAITRCDMIDGRFIVTTVDSEKPVGLCGSGLIDIVALLLDNEVIDATGRLRDPDKAREAGAPETLVSRIRRDGRVCSFVLYEDDAICVELAQKDIREVQLAKAAMAAGARILLHTLGVDARELSRVMLAGAFGSHIRAKSALRIGLLPDVAPDRVIQLGNAAGAGACMALMSAREAAEANDIARRAEHVELASHTDFQREFIEAMRF